MTLDKMELVPGSGQNFWEVIIGGLMGMLEKNLGEKGAKMLFPMMATFFHDGLLLTALLCFKYTSPNFVRILRSCLLVYLFALPCACNGGRL